MESKPKHSPLGRPRSQQALQAVLTATQELLDTQGYKSLTMEGIARAAGVGKPTLYRWWPNVPSIVMETVKLQAQADIGIPDTGSLKSDMLLYLGQTCRILAERSGEVMRCLMAEAQLDADFARSFRETFISHRRNTLIEIVQRGVRRGELPPETDLAFIADLCYGPIWYRLLNRHAPLDEAFVRAIVERIV